jgi:xylulokinase
MTSSGLLLGIDVGTTATKVAVFDLAGRPLAMAAARYPLVTNGAAAEQDPADWWRATGQALASVLATINPHDLLAVCVGGQGPTMVAVDEALQPVGPALTWLDWRARPEASRLSELAGRPLPPHAFIAKVSWLRHEWPARYQAARWFCQAWDFVALQLTGVPAASVSPGIAPWSAEWIEVAGLDADRFPPQVLMGDSLGQVTAAAARATGLPAGLPVIGGISDYFEGLIGSGALAPGLACDHGGTSQSFNVCWDASVQAGGIFCTPSFTDGQWYVGGPVSTTGKALAWWCTDVLGGAPDDGVLLAEAEAVPAGSERLIFLPYLAGERAPLWDPTARGVFFGLGLEHRREHMTRAVLEAVAYALRHLIEHIEAAGAEVHEIRACGGQARSEAWCRIKADVTGRPLAVPEFAEAGVLGAAMIAAVGVGAVESYASAARKMVRRRQLIFPDPARHAHYQDLYRLYRDLYEALRPLNERLQTLTAETRTQAAPAAVTALA